MICPWCQSDNVFCKDSRPSGIGRRRRYRCGNCGGRFSTMELPVRLDQERGPSQRGPLRHEGRKGTDCHAVVRDGSQ